MKAITMLGAMATAAALLSACGGSGGSTTTSTRTTPPPPSAVGPLSTNPSDLIAFASGGGTTQVIHGTPFYNQELAQQRTNSGVLRTTRQGTFDGQPITVILDRLPGSDVGLLQYRLGDAMSAFSLVGSSARAVSLPSGIYNGFLDFSYTLDGTTWLLAQGEASLRLNMETGAVSIDGIAGNAANNIEIFGSAVASGGAFEDPNLIVRLRDGSGLFIRDEQGVASGIFGSGTDTDAIFGTISANNPSNGFRLEGGFNAIRHLEP